jgi:23S rRNA pseudouridine2605 synthase
MRINKYIAQATGLSRRTADAAIAAGRVKINGQSALTGVDVGSNDQVSLDDRPLSTSAPLVTIIVNKPTGYVVSRDGQGSRTIYDLLPPQLHHLKPVGRLDKDSSGLLLLTNDGQLANELTHPRYAKQKVYQVTLDKPLQPLHQQMISDHGVQLADGASKFLIISQPKADPNSYELHLGEGRNRQIRRTFAALGYTVTTLHRTSFGPYSLLPGLKAGQYDYIKAG